MDHRDLRYRQAIGFVVDDESDTIRRTTPNLTLQISESEHDWADDRLARERAREDRAWHNDLLASGAKCPFPSQNISTHCYGHSTLEVQHLAGVIATLEPPVDKSIKTLVVCGFNSRILEQTILDKFSAYGVIKSIRFFAREGRALVTYTDREGAEKATQGLSKWLLINGQRLKLAWGRPQDHETDQDSLNQQGTVADSGLLSQQQNRPSAMDLGAVTSTQEVGGSSTSEPNEASSSNIPIICEYCRVVERDRAWWTREMEHACNEASSSSSSYERPPQLPLPSEDEYRTSLRRSKI
ncbi:hypothetical protein ARALYDRAFT_337999 [Arabidopsis lyrata subsp. lyrata]|uniref:RRM domain-containing protein n=1 Tax=Arabidopsis lyrata subsp. lyrata TaxID=81972 RepID=D7KTD9_ARALL|nr:hypothetical protein ARALYDRAFT_337999 [Arabidopsis lyrata subsp. lyrata]